MKSDLSVLTAATRSLPLTHHDRPGYPLRVIAVYASALALAIVWLVARPGLSPGLAWALTGTIAIAALLLAVWRTRLLAHARSDNAHVLAALGAATAEIPPDLRTRMPVVLVTGDDLPMLFDRADGERFAYVGDGAVWLRVDQPRDLPRLAIAVRQWRDGRSPDGIVLAVAPARYPDADMLTQSLRTVRQVVADTARMLGSRALPGYVAVYHRLTPERMRQRDDKGHGDHGAPALAEFVAPQWYGVSSATPMPDARPFETIVRAAESEAWRIADNGAAATRAAALASIVDWTQRVVIHALTDARQPAAPWALFGAGWIDCGPANGPGNPWEQDVAMRTHVVRASCDGSPAPWPLPQPLIRSIPQRLWMSPRLVALAHALTLLACAAAAAFLFSALNNRTLLTRIGADLGRYAMIPAEHDTAKRDALRALIADRDELERHARTGVPLYLSFGMYRAPRLVPLLNDAIASYQPPPPPPPPPAVVTLDSMALFDSGNARLKAGSTRLMVNALEMIRAHPNKRILVAGHTDNVGSADNNLRLSKARAEAVRDWLIEASGIAPTQFAIQGYGDARPIAANDTEAGRARNRRVEITLVPDLAAKDAR